jgi:hypothetical protein
VKSAAQLLEAPEVEGKALALGIVCDEAWERRLEALQVTVASLRQELADVESSSEARIRVLEGEWRQRLEEQQVRVRSGDNRITHENS